MIYAPANQLLTFTACQSRVIWLCCADTKEKHTTLQTMSPFPLCELLFNFLFAGLDFGAIESIRVISPQPATTVG